MKDFNITSHVLSSGNQGFQYFNLVTLQGFLSHIKSRYKNKSEKLDLLKYQAEWVLNHQELIENEKNEIEHTLALTLEYETIEQHSQSPMLQELLDHDIFCLLQLNQHKERIKHEIPQLEEEIKQLKEQIISLSSEIAMKQQEKVKNQIKNIFIERRKKE